MRSILPFSFISFLFLSSQTHAQDKPKTHATYDYLLYLPKDYADNEASYPLLIYLHGGSQRGQDLSKLKTYGLPYLVEKGRNFSFIIASPQCPAGKFWSTDNWFEPLYKNLITKYRVDTNRVYLTGISMGGYGAWQTTVAYPDKFAAVVPLCGGCDDSTRICRIKHVPIWAFHGTADDVIPIAETEIVVKKLTQCGGRVTFTRLENEGHGIQYLYENQAIYDWLLKQYK